MKIGVFGLGLMGFPIACNLKEDGNEVMGFDPNPASQERMKENGILVANTAREVGEFAELTFLILNINSQFKSCLDGTDGFLAGVGNDTGKTVIDLTTSDPVESVALGEELRAHGVNYLDCGMTGGRAGAVERKLVFMAGGDKALYEKWKPTLTKLSKSVNYIGPQGCGHAMKLLHNAVSHSVFTATMEATVLGQKMGMDLQAMVDVFNVGNARSYATEVRYPKHILSGTYDMGYTFKSGEKDFRLILKTAANANFKMPIAECTYDYWKYGCEHGSPDGDTTTMHKLMKDKNSY